MMRKGPKRGSRFQKSFDQDGVLSKRCSYCEVVKSVAEFSIKNGQKGPIYFACCKKCRRQVERRYFGTPGRFGNAKGQAHRNGYDWTLDREKFTELMYKNCEYCGLFFRSIGEFAGTGLDRIDNSRGYHNDNVVSCCSECNIARNDRFSYSEMKNYLGPVIRKVMQRRYWCDFSNSDFFKNSALS